MALRAGDAIADVVEKEGALKESFGGNYSQVQCGPGPLQLIAASGEVALELVGLFVSDQEREALDIAFRTENRLRG